MTRTKYMSHFDSATEGYLNAQVAFNKSNGGLAGEMFLGLKELAAETDTLGKALDDLFAAAMKESEEKLTDKLPDGVSLSAFCGSYKSRKSELRRAIKEGLDPNKFPSFRKYIDAVKKADTNTPNAKAGGGSNTSKPEGKGGSNIAALKPANNANPKISEATNRLFKLLASLPEEDQLKVLSGAEGKCHQLLKKAGARFANVKAAQ